MESEYAHSNAPARGHRGSCTERTSPRRDVPRNSSKRSSAYAHSRPRAHACIASLNEASARRSAALHLVERLERARVGPRARGGERARASSLRRGSSPVGQAIRAALRALPRAAARARGHRERRRHATSQRGRGRISSSSASALASGPRERTPQLAPRSRRRPCSRPGHAPVFERRERARPLRRRTLRSRPVARVAALEAARAHLGEERQATRGHSFALGGRRSLHSRTTVGRKSRRAHRLEQPERAAAQCEPHTESAALYESTFASSPRAHCARSAVAPLLASGSFAARDRRERYSARIARGRVKRFPPSRAARREPRRPRAHLARGDG